MTFFVINRCGLIGRRFGGIVTRGANRRGRSRWSGGLGFALVFDCWDSLYSHYVIACNVTPSLCDLLLLGAVEPIHQC